MLLLSSILIKILLKNSFMRSVSIKFGPLLDELRMISKEFFWLDLFKVLKELSSQTCWSYQLELNISRTSIVFCP